MKTSLWIAPAAFALLAACSGERPQATPSGTPADGSAPAAAVEESLPTAEEEAAKAAEAIDEANADAELQRLQKELGDG